MKRIVCDSSSLIALSSTCLTWILDKFEVDFLIPHYVRKEIIDNPMNSKRYSFDAMRNGLLIGSTLKVEKTDPKLRDKIIKLSNSLLVHKGKPIEIIQYGEADALALAISEKIDAVLVDEKNTRLLIENIEILKRVVQKRTRKTITINDAVAREMSSMLGHLKVLRSTELVAVAIKRGLLDWPYPKKDLARSILRALKYSGCSISSGEILELANIIATTKVQSPSSSR